MADSGASREKVDTLEIEGGGPHDHQHHHHILHHGSSKQDEEIGRIDAIALAPGTTFQSFAHLDEKKILRKARLTISYVVVVHMYSLTRLLTDGHPPHSHACCPLPPLLPRP